MRSLLASLLPVLSASFLVPHTNVGGAHHLVARHGPPSLGLFDGLKKMIDPEDAMSKNTLANDIQSTDDSPAAVEAREKKALEMERRREQGDQDTLSQLKDFKLPNLLDGMPNPFKK